MLGVLDPNDELTLEGHLFGWDIYFWGFYRIVGVDYNSDLVIIAEGIFKGRDQGIDDHLGYQRDIVDL